jgi:hypothetical protein
MAFLTCMYLVLNRPGAAIPGNVLLEYCNCLQRCQETNHDINERQVKPILINCNTNAWAASGPIPVIYCEQPFNSTSTHTVMRTTHTPAAQSIVNA